mmetsp:Transcript_33672/g.76911  ORF Transcript_33672/g.76911 Transcript_33672/m.76911 type:complete len:105 (+) Transcript_33672:67-381(+)
MARCPIRSALLLAGLVALGLRAAFVSSPSAAPKVVTEQGFLASATAASVAVLGAAPVLAEELPPDEIYNRKVLEAASYCLIFAAFLVGLVIFQARKLVENKWLN